MRSRAGSCQNDTNPTSGPTRGAFMPQGINLDRRGFFGAAGMTIVAAKLGMLSAASAQSSDVQTVASANGAGGQQARTLTPANPKNTSFASMKQVSAGALNVGYAEDGPADGQPVILLHGWPFDIHAFVDVAPLLAKVGYRVIVPYQRGYGSTTFLSPDTFRNAQQSVCAEDVVNLMDALKIKKAILGGFDIGSRTAGGGGILWPRRGKGVGLVRGDLIAKVTAKKVPAPPKPEDPFCDTV